MDPIIKDDIGEKKHVMKNLIIPVIEFLLLTKSNDLLFQEIKDTTKVFMGSIDLFMECLEPFLLVIF